MTSTKFMPLVRLVASSVLLVAQAVVPVSSFATVCDGGSNLSDVKEKDGVLWVRGKFGQTATTSDMGKTWSIDKKRASDSRVFWDKSFVLSNGEMYQNVPTSINGGMYVITKKKNAELWEDSTENFILFARGDQLFSFRGKLSRSSMLVRLFSGVIYGTASSNNDEIWVEVSSSYLCKLENGKCNSPYPWDSFDRDVTGFYAQKNGNFFLSTHDSIFYFDAKADQWSNISKPPEWRMQCP